MFHLKAVTERSKLIMILLQGLAYFSNFLFHISSQRIEQAWERGTMQIYNIAVAHYTNDSTFNGRITFAKGSSSIT